MNDRSCVLFLLAFTIAWFVYGLVGSFTQRQDDARAFVAGPPPSKW